MYYKLKNTLAGLSVAVALLGVSYVAGRPPMASDTRFDVTSPSLETRMDAPQVLRRHSLRRSLSMPYFSFGPLLPRRES
jgi:hypothetical protein